MLLSCTACSNNRNTKTANKSTESVAKFRYWKLQKRVKIACRTNQEQIAVRESLLPFDSVFCIPFCCPKYVRIKIYRAAVLLVVLFGFETWSLSHWGRNTGWGYSRMGCWGSCLGLRGRKWQETGENCVMRSFMICTTHQILFGWCNREEWDGLDMWNVWDRRCIQGFGGKTRMKKTTWKTLA